MLNKEMPALNMPEKGNEVKGSAALLKYQLGWTDQKKSPVRKKEWWIRVPRKWWLIELKNLSPVERCILITLKIHADKNNIAWPSYQLIANELKISKQTIFRVMKTLKKKGFYKIEKSSGRLNSYKLKSVSL